MRVLVTGGTGLIGSWVVRELRSRRHAVRVLVRPQSDLSNLAGCDVELARGDVLDSPSVEAALEGCDAVVHCAGHVQFGDRARLGAVNAGGVEVVLGAALRAGIRRALLTSSTAVMGGSRRPTVADEASPMNADGLGIDYFESKSRGEAAALTLFERGLPVVVVRPSVVLGPGDVYRSSGGTVLALARRALPFYVDGGTSYCDVRDVARGHAEALERGTPGDVYILGGANLATTDMIRRVCQICGVPPPRRLAYPLARAAVAVAAWAARRSGRMPKVSTGLVQASHLYTFVSSEKARRQLGYESRPFEDSVRDTLRWFMERGRLKPTTPELRALMRADPQPAML